jgi:hypothetical protein
MNRTNRSLRTLQQEWQRIFRRRRERHDPMLVMNMSIFNFDGGWNRVFNPFKAHR